MPPRGDSLVWNGDRSGEAALDPAKPGMLGKRPGNRHDHALIRRGVRWRDQQINSFWAFRPSRGTARRDRWPGNEAQQAGWPRQKLSRFTTPEINDIGVEMRAPDRRLTYEFYDGMSRAFGTHSHILWTGESAVATVCVGTAVPNAR